MLPSDKARAVDISTCTVNWPMALLSGNFKLEWISLGEHTVRAQAAEKDVAEGQDETVVTLDLDVSGLAQDGGEERDRRVVIDCVMKGSRQHVPENIWNPTRKLREYIGGLLLEADAAESSSRPIVKVLETDTDNCYSASSLCTGYIDDNGSVVRIPDRIALQWPKIYIPESCALDGMFVLFTYPYGEDPAMTMYNPDTKEWTHDSRDLLLLESQSAYTVENDVLHVFGRERHITYTVWRGCREEEKIPSSIGRIQQAQSFDRLILLFGDSGIHIYDCISGDYTKVAKGYTT
ncbi:hypothetical protein KIPB_005423, partial [Kipferlia bialata]|eukprot:g5423.t1